MGRHKRGIDAKAYVNTGSWGTPTWVELTTARDVVLDLSVDEDEITDRGSDFKKFLPTLVAAEVTLDVAWDKTDTVLEDIRDAWAARGVVEMAFMDEAIATSGAQGLHAEMSVFGKRKRENRGEAQVLELTLKPGDGDNDPEWLTTP